MSIIVLEAKSIPKAASTQFIVQNARGLVDAKQELLHVGTALCVSTICLPAAVTRDHISYLCIYIHLITLLPNRHFASLEKHINAVPPIFTSALNKMAIQALTILKNKSHQGRCVTNSVNNTCRLLNNS